jgi:hypothetical protein
VELLKIHAIIHMVVVKEKVPLLLHKFPLGVDYVKEHQVKIKKVTG